MAPYGLLDAWRGVAALWVALLHACVAVVVNLYPDFASNPLCAVGLWGQLGVPMFFVISGYCITQAAVSASGRPLPVRRFLKARFRRIYPPYLATLILTVLLSLLAGFLAARGLVANSSLAALGFFDDRGALYYFANLTLTQVPLQQEPTVVVFWTLCYEVAFYLIVALVLGSLIRLQKTAWLTPALHLVTFASLAWLLLSPMTCPFPLNLWYQFGLGIAVWEGLHAPRRARVSLGIAAIAVLVVLYAAVHNHGKGIIGDVPSRIQALVSLGFAAGLFLLWNCDRALTRAWWVRLLSWVGTFSYSLYLMHLLSLSLISQVARKLHVPSSWYWLVVLVQLAVAIVAAWGFYWCFERPFLKQAASKRTQALAGGEETPLAALPRPVASLSRAQS